MRLHSRTKALKGGNGDGGSHEEEKGMFKLQKEDLRGKTVIEERVFVVVL